MLSTTTFWDLRTSAVASLPVVSQMMMFLPLGRGERGIITLEEIPKRHVLKKDLDTLMLFMVAPV